MGRESLNDKRPTKNTLALCLKNIVQLVLLYQEGNAYLAILGSGNITVEKCPGFQSRLGKFLTEVVRIVVVVIKKCIDNRKGGRRKSATPFTNTLIDLSKGVIRKLLRRTMDAYESKNRALDCNYVWDTLPIDEVPDLLLDGYSFIIIDSPNVFLRISAGQVLQIGRDKDTAPGAIVLRTTRKVCICKFFLTACPNTLVSGWWRCVLKFYNSLEYNCQKMI